MLFTRAGFKVLEIIESFENQYQLIFAKPIKINTNLYSKFLESSNKKTLQNKLKKYKNIAIWGAGAKGVTMANYISNIACIIDINPNKQHCFIPKSAIKIVSPKEAIEKYNLDYILVMNPNYINEIKHITKEYDILVESII